MSDNYDLDRGRQDQKSYDKQTPKDETANERSKLIDKETTKNKRERESSERK